VRGSLSLTQKAALCCLCLMALIWAAFLVLKFSMLTENAGPALAHLLLASLIVSVLAPFAAIGFSMVTLIRDPALLKSWAVFAAACLALVAEFAFFLITRMM
jgi:hypothetical protein